jgi:hypothetical protein
VLEYFSKSRGKRLGVAFCCLAAALIAGCDPGGSGEGIDPGIVEIPIAFIKRPVPVDDMGAEVQPDVREPRLFMAGGDVYLSTSSAAGASITNITREVTGGTGDVKGLNANHEGTRLIFSLRLFDPDVNDDVVPSWNIYEYNLEDASLRRIITSQLIAEQGDDLYPAYLPDGRILFTSDRQRQSREMLINEGKQSFASLDESENVQALVLHVMNADGTDIHQISYNQSHDLFPQVLTRFKGGKIVFSRWDNAVGNNEINLYTANPDGSEMEILYGSRSHATGTGGATIQFTNFREMENGDLMVITRPFDGTFDGGDIEIIDVKRFADNRKSIWPLRGLPGQAQADATISDVANDGSISVNGRYATAFPLWDGSNRILVSKSTCQLELNNEIRPCIDPYIDNPAASEKSPAYAIWLYDMDVDTQKPIVLAEPETVITEAITIENRTRAPIVFDKKLLGDLNNTWETEIVGVVNIKSVYDMGDTSFNGCFFNVCTSAAGIGSVQDFADPANALAAERPARFVRFIRPVGIPDPDDPSLVDPPDLDNDAFGPQRNRGMRQIVGYAPVEPDGSVKVKVPANIPLAVEVLDGEGRRIGPRHDNWFQVQPGDTLTCTGCHDLANGGNPPEIHARGDGEAPSINAGVPGTGQLANTLIPGTPAPNPYFGTPGRTLAEVRFDSWSLEQTTPDMPTPTIEPQLDADLVYRDYWTDPAVRARDTKYEYRYTDLLAAMTPPTNSFCIPWAYNCRVTINYPDHIHEIFQLDRGVDAFTPLAPANPANNDPTNTPLVVDAMMTDGIGDDTCVSCHTTANGTRLPYGQLDLTSDPNQDPNNRYRSYQQMFQNRQGQFFDAGAMSLQPFTVLDANGNPVNDPAASIAPIMTSAGARRSFFIEKMTGTELEAGRAIQAGTVDHTAMLSGAELKLISEWLDLGAQNFNDPFDPEAPQN